MKIPNDPFKLLAFHLILCSRYIYIKFIQRLYLWIICTTQIHMYRYVFLSLALQTPLDPSPSLFRFMIILQTVGLLGRVISSSQGLYLNTGQHKHRINTYTYQTSMPCVGFETMIPASERARTVHPLDRSAAVISVQVCLPYRLLERIVKTWAATVPDFNSNFFIYSMKISKDTWGNINSHFTAELYPQSNEAEPEVPITQHIVTCTG
jgi:hypothetical protein